MNNLTVLCRLLMRGLLAIVFVVAPGRFSTAQAQNVDADTVIDRDHYVFGDELSIDGVVNGDLVACARLIHINGTINGDLVAAGQVIVIGGTVTDDVRVACQVLQIRDTARIGDDLISASFSLETGGASSVGGNAICSGFQALLDGDIGGKINSAFANCEILGHVANDVKLDVADAQFTAMAFFAGLPPAVEIPDVPAGLTIRDTARIDGDLVYRSPEPARIADGASIQGEIRQQQSVAPSLTPAQRAADILAQYLCLLVVGIGLLLVAPGWMRKMTDIATSRPLASAGFGIAGFAGFLLVLLVLFVVMIALAVAAGFLKLPGLIPVFVLPGLSGAAFLIVGFWFFVSWVAQILLCLVVGQKILGVCKPSLAENRFLALVAGLLLYTLIMQVPWLGSIVVWLAILLGIGGLVIWIRGKKHPVATATSDKSASAPV